MRRPTAVAATMALLLISSGPSQGPAAKRGDAKREMIVDKSWIPEPGDRALIYRSDGLDVFVATDIFSYEECIKFQRAGDTDGLKQLARDRRVALVKSGTPILVIERHNNPLIAKGASAIELRILEGEQKDGKVWVYEGEVNRLVEKPIDPSVERAKKFAEDVEADRAAKEAAKGKLYSRPARAEALLTIAKNLEKSGKPKPALENYRKVVAEFGDTPAAKSAAGRIKALAGK